MKYRTIVADPPWLERGGGKSKRGADRHYPLMNAHDIAVTMAEALSYAWELAGGWFHPDSASAVADSAHLWLWVTDNFLEDGLRVMSRLGFRYVRTLVWVKTQLDERGALELEEDECESGDIYPRRHLQIGLGQYLRGAHELCLLGVRGETCLPDTADRQPSVVFAPRNRHSAKPQAAFDVIEKTSPGPRLEMFARRPREGWDVWGNEVQPSE